LKKNLEPQVFSMMLYLIHDKKDQSLMNMMGDLLRRETDADFFNKYVSGKASETLSQIFSKHKFT